MCDEKKDRRSSKVNSSKHLLYSEIADSSIAGHVVEVLENKEKAKPKIQFEKSLVLKKYSKLAELLEKSQNEFNEKSPDEYNIEVLDSESYVNMDVAVVRPLSEEAYNPVESTRDLELIKNPSEFDMDSDSEKSDESEFSNVHDIGLSQSDRNAAESSESSRESKGRLTMMIGAGSRPDSPVSYDDSRYFEVVSEDDSDFECQSSDLEILGYRSESSESDDNESVSSQDYTHSDTNEPDTRESRQLITVIEDESKPLTDTANNAVALEYECAKSLVSLLSQDAIDRSEENKYAGKENKNLITDIPNENKEMLQEQPQKKMRLK